MTAAFRPKKVTMYLRIRWRRRLATAALLREHDEKISTGNGPTANVTDGGGKCVTMMLTRETSGLIRPVSLPAASTYCSLKLRAGGPHAPW